MMSTETFSSRHFCWQRHDEAGETSIELPLHPSPGTTPRAGEITNQRVQHLKQHFDSVSIPLEHISIWRGFAIFRLDDREERRAESFALEPDEFNQVVLGILVNIIIGADPFFPFGIIRSNHLVAAFGPTLSSCLKLFGAFAQFAEPRRPGRR